MAGTFSGECARPKGGTRKAPTFHLPKTKKKSKHSQKTASCVFCHPLVNGTVHCQCVPMALSTASVRNWHCPLPMHAGGSVHQSQRALPAYANAHYHLQRPPIAMCPTFVRQWHFTLPFVGGGHCQCTPMAVHYKCTTMRIVDIHRFQVALRIANGGQWQYDIHRVMQICLHCRLKAYDLNAND